MIGRSLLSVIVGGACVLGPRSAVADDVGLSSAPVIAFQWRSQPRPPFEVGESILYAIKYGLVPAGSAVIEVTSLETVDGRAAYKIRSEARTNKTLDIFYKVRDVNESWMDRESLCSLRFQQDIREGRYARQVDTVYDHPGRSFRYVKRRKGKESTELGGIPPFVQDVLSSLYFLRTQPLEAGNTIALDANSGAKNWPLLVHILGKEETEVPAGKFECYHLEPVLAGDGIFQASGQLEVWVTVDPPHIPVLLRSKVVVGAFDAEMTSYRPGLAPLEPS